MKIVLDTNVLVSGLLSPFGPPARVLALIISGELVVCYDERIIAEYRAVLARDKFAFEKSSVDNLIRYLGNSGLSVHSVPLEHRLPDRDDEPFLEVAIASVADALITGNIVHYPVRSRKGVKIVNPRTFLDSVYGA